MAIDYFVTLFFYYRIQNLNLYVLHIYIIIYMLSWHYFTLIYFPEDGVPIHEMLTVSNK